MGTPASYPQLILGALSSFLNPILGPRSTPILKPFSSLLKLYSSYPGALFGPFQPFSTHLNPSQPILTHLRVLVQASLAKPLREITQSEKFWRNLWGGPQGQPSSNTFCCKTCGGDPKENQAATQAVAKPVGGTPRKTKQHSGCCKTFGWDSKQNQVAATWVLLHWFCYMGCYAASATNSATQPKKVYEFNFQSRQPASKPHARPPASVQPPSPPRNPLGTS